MRVRALAVTVIAAIAVTGCAVVQRVSLAPSGEANAASVEPALAADGSVMAFTSLADNLVAADANEVADVFVRDASGTMTRISVASNGAEANGPSSHPSVSATGRFVAFQSDATNLVIGDTNATTDVFVRDRTTGTTTLVSAPAPGAPTGSVAPAPGAAAPAPARGSTTTSVAARNASLRARATVAPTRVIIRLASRFRAEGRLTATNRAAQRRTIRADQDRVATILSPGGRVLARARTLPIVVAEVDAAAFDRLAASPDVLGITPDDPVPSALFNSGPVVGLPAALDAGYTGRGEAVAILDTGVDSAHAFLAGRVVNESCFSAFGNCPNGQATQAGAGAAVPCAYAPTGCRHGTHVAGIAAGNGLDADGVAPRASIIAVQIFSRFTGSLCARGEDPCPLTLPSDWILALEHVYELRDTYRIAAVNMSIGGLTSTTACDSDAVKPAIDQLRSVGIATVIAAGNEGLSNAVGYPACISSSVAVGATNDADAVAAFSNSSPLVDLFAPGVLVRSSVPGGGFAFFNGTSMATPHVAGAWALAKEQDPDATVDDVLASFRDTGRTIRDPRNGLDIPRLCTSGALGFNRCPNRNGSRRPSISADGQKVAFESDAALVGSDSNGAPDIYRRTVDTATTERISISTGGAQGLAPSSHPSISDDGARIAFDSTASELVAGDTNGVMDVFVRDVSTSTTVRASVATGGSQVVAVSREASISGDGSTVAFASTGVLAATDTNTVADVYARDLSGAVTTTVSLSTNGASANGPSRAPSLTRDARFVTFSSDATNLDGPGLGHTDVFVRDRASGLTQRASTGFWLGAGNAASFTPVAADTGGIIAFTSTATDLVDGPDGNGAFDVFRRAIVAPTDLSSGTGPVARGQTVPFTITGKGLRAPLSVTVAGGATFAVTAVTPTTITGTVSVPATMAVGPWNVVIAAHTGLSGVFGGGLCLACLTVT